MNKYNLDTAYFKKNLERIIRDIENYTPEEMERALNILADVAKHERTSDKMTIVKGRDVSVQSKYRMSREYVLDYCSDCNDSTCSGECMENL